MNKEIEVLETYMRQQNNRIADLNQEILVLQTKIDILERGIDEQNKLPVPPLHDKKLMIKMLRFVN